MQVVNTVSLFQVIIVSMASVEARSSSQLSEHAGSLRSVQPYQAAFGRLTFNLFERKARRPGGYFTDIINVQRPAHGTLLFIGCRSGA